MDEFDDIQIEDKLHIIISVKDFRAVLQHANWTSAELSAAYSRPGRPMKLSYSGDGVICEFVLMTVGEKGTAAQKKGKGRVNGAKAPRPALEAARSRAGSVANNNGNTQHPISPEKQQPVNQQSKTIQPRANPARSTQFDIRPAPVQPVSTLRSESLFLPQPDEDEQWEPVNPDEDEDDGENARLEWDASNRHVSNSAPSQTICTNQALQNPSNMRISSAYNTQRAALLDGGNFPSMMDATQPLTDVQKFSLFSK